MAENADEPISSEAQETPSEGKKGGLPIIPIAIVVVLIGVIGAVAWFVIMPMLSGGEGEAAEQGEAAMAEEETEAVYDPEAQRGIIEFDSPFTVKLRRNEGVLATETYLLVALSLEVETPDIQTKMTGDQVVMARIEDTINTFFAGQFPQNLEPPQWPRLKEELKERVNVQFGEDYHIKQIYFHQFLLQPGG